VTPKPQPLSVVLVDDEPLARLRLRQLLADLPDVAAEVVAECEEADAALAWLRAGGQADVVLLDIRMPGRDGLQLADAMRRLPRPPAVIFVTAHPQHALRAFELQALDYLPKPVRKERLREALGRVPSRSAGDGVSAGTGAQDMPPLVVVERGRVLRIPLDEVLYLRAEMKYVTLRTALHRHVLDESLAELEPRLGPGFLRIHRSVIVSRPAMRELALHAQAAGEEAWALRVAPTDEWLPVSRRQLAELRQALR
jgi:two-component system, LytTR family, response regulator AlgR